jgi:hypothetical protein
MPDNTRQVSTGNNSQQYTLGDRRFAGIDTNTPPNMLDVGFMQNCNNLYIDGIAMRPRPGFQGQLNTANVLANPIYSMIAYKDADTTVNKIVFVSGTGIYMHSVGSTTAPTLLGTGTWSSSDATGVRMVQFGKYIYGVPGKNGTSLFRTIPASSTFETVPQLDSLKSTGTILDKPTATYRLIPVKTLSAYTDIDNTAYPIQTATIAISNQTIGVTNNYVANDIVTFSTTVGNITKGVPYYVLASGLTSTGFKISLTSGGTAITPSSNGSTTVTNQYRKPQDSTGAWQNVWSDDLMKRSTGVTTIPSGDFDRYPSDLPLDTNLQADWTGPGSGTASSVKQYSDVNFAQNDSLRVKAPSSKPTYAGYTQKGMLLDNPGEYCQQIIENLPQEIYYPENALRTVGLYNIQWYTFANIPKSSGSLNYTITVTGMTSSADIGGCVFSKQFTVNPPQSNSDWVQNNIVVDFREFASLITRLKVKWTNSSSMAAQAVIVDFIRVHASLAAFGTSSDKPLDQNKLISIKFNQTNPNLLTRNASYIAERRIRFSASGISTEILKKMPQMRSLSLQWNFEDVYLENTGIYPNVTLGIQVGSTIAWSSYGEWDKANRYMTFNLFQLTAAQKTNPSYFYVKFDVDVMATDGSMIASGQPAFSIGSLVGDGGLSPTGTYEYAVTRWVPSNQSTMISPDTVLTDGTTATGYEAPLSDISDIFRPRLSATSSTVNINPKYLINATSYDYKVDPTLDRFNLSVATDITDADQWCSRQVKPESQIRVISTSDTATLTYVNTSGATVSISSWTLASGSTAVWYATLASPIKYVTAITSGVTMWIEHYISYGTTDTSIYSHLLLYRRNNDMFTDGRFRVAAILPTKVRATVTSGNTVIVCDNSFVANDTIVFETTVGNITAGVTYYVRSNVLTSTSFEISTTSGGSVLTPSASGVTNVTSAITIKGNSWSAYYDLGNTPEILFYDEIPDGNLTIATGVYKQGWYFEQGRDNFPLGASVIATHQRRLCVAKANKVYMSWALQQDNEYGIYTTEIPDFGEPSVQRKGISFTVGGLKEQEVVAAMISTFDSSIVQDNSSTSTLLIVKENSVSTVIGFNPTDFNVQVWISSPGVGIAAPQTAMSNMGQITWLTANGVIEYRAGQVVPLSIQLRKLWSLDPTMGGPTLDKALYKQSISTTANQRIFFLSTYAGDTNPNTTFYMYDQRTQGWMRWSIPTGINSFTAMTTLAFANDIQYVYTGASNGQIYKLTGSADKLHADSASTVEIPWSYTSRQHGQTYSEGYAYYANNRPFQLDLHVENRDATSSPDSTLKFNWSVQNALGVYNSSTNPYGVSTAGYWNFPQNSNKTACIRSLNKSVKGPVIQVQLSGTSKGIFGIFGVHMHMFETAIPRSNG